MSLALPRTLCRILSRRSSAPSSGFLRGGGETHCPAVQNRPWLASLKTSAPLRGEPLKKKKKADPRRDLLTRERLRKKLKKLEKVPPELIPIEDFMVPSRCLDEARVRPAPLLSFEESERRALLLKEWSRYKQMQHMVEMEAVERALEAQREAVEDLRLEECEGLYRAALEPDPLLFPFSHQGPAYTAPRAQHQAPDGKYNDITRVYTQ